jgi:hypothetical protein
MRIISRVARSLGSIERFSATMSAWVGFGAECRCPPIGKGREASSLCYPDDDSFSMARPVEFSVYRSPRRAGLGRIASTSGIIASVIQGRMLFGSPAPDGNRIRPACARKVSLSAVDWTFYKDWGLARFGIVAVDRRSVMKLEDNHPGTFTVRPRNSP